MIRLERLQVKNYKNIAQADLSFGQMNFVVGENNSGKSNLLEILPLLNYIINGTTNEVRYGFEWGGDFSNFGTIHYETSIIEPIQPISILIDFNDAQRDEVYSYKLELRSGKQEKSPFVFPLVISKEIFTSKKRNKTGKPAILFHRERNKVKYGSGIKKTDSITSIDDSTSVIRLLSIIYSSETVTKDYRLAINNLLLIISSHIFYFSPHLLREEETKFENKNRIALYDLNSEIELLEGSKDWKAYLAMLKSIVNITDVDILSIFDGVGAEGQKVREKKRAYFYQHGRMKRRDELSDGSLVLIALITKIFSDASDIFFIEEPENSIHPYALRELMRLIRAKSEDKQFVITTHSPYLLNMTEPQEIFVASVNSKGKSEISKLQDVKAIKKKLAKGFMDFGDIVFSEPDSE